MVTRQIRVTGRVQGVGFRHGLRREAERNDVRGWVRNRADGSVEAVLQGEACAVARVVEWARTGPAAAQVVALAESVPDKGAEYRRFEERPTE